MCHPPPRILDTFLREAMCSPTSLLYLVLLLGETLAGLGALEGPPRAPFLRKETLASGLLSPSTFSGAAEEDTRTTHEVDRVAHPSLIGRRHQEEHFCAGLAKVPRFLHQPFSQDSDVQAQWKDWVNIVTFGNSFTLGHGCGESVSQDQHDCAWPRRLERWMRVAFPRSHQTWHNEATSGVGTKDDPSTAKMVAIHATLRH